MFFPKCGNACSKTFLGSSYFLLLMQYIAPLQVDPSKNEQLELVAAAKAKAKAKGKGKGKEKPKGKGAAKAKAKSKAKAAAKKPAARAKGKAKAAPKKAAAKAKSKVLIDIDKILEKQVDEDGKPVDLAKLRALQEKQERLKRPAASSKAKARADKKLKVEIPETPLAVKDLEENGLVPHTFGGRGRPSGGWALEKYARTAATFKRTIEPKLPAGTKNKAQAGSLITLET